MNREERLKALNEIEGQLSQYLAADKKNWIHTYLLMSEVQDKELYAAQYRSYTKWVNHLADSLSIHVSTLWARLKAGKNYAEYAARAAEHGRTVPKIEEIDVSPDSLNLCAKVAGKNAVEMDKLVEQVMSGNLTRENLRQAAKARKAAGGFVATSKFDCIQAKDRTEMAEKITAADIILALQSSDWLFEQDVTNPVWEKVITDPREPVKKTYVNPPRPNASVMDEASHRISPKMSQIDEVPNCCFRQHGISDYGYSLSSATWSRGRSVTCL